MNTQLKWAELSLEQKENTLKILTEKGLSSYEIARQLDLSQSNVRHWLKKFNLKTDKTLNKAQQIFKCKGCGETDSTMFYLRKQKNVKKDSRRTDFCKDCTNIKITEKHKEKKKKAVIYKGCKCQKCQIESKDYEIYDFHHVNPEQKDHNWRELRNCSWDNIKKEIDKCQLLCTNCHREVHDEIQNNRQHITKHRETRLKIKQSIINSKGGKCKHCGYDKCLSALSFHHDDPNSKEVQIGENDWNYNLLSKQIQKCSLLCEVCHRLEHKRMRNEKTPE